MNEKLNECEEGEGAGEERRAIQFGDGIFMPIYVIRIIIIFELLKTEGHGAIAFRNDTNII